MPLTATQSQEYRLLLQEINRMAQADLVAVWRRLEYLDKNRLFKALAAGVPEIVEMYRAVCAETAGLFYEETQGIAVVDDIAMQATVANAEQIDRSLRWVMYGRGGMNALSLIGGIVQKHVIDGSRDYGLLSMGQQREYWVRDARPGACTFCRLLATRGMPRNDGTPTPAYTSEDAAVVRGGGMRTREAKAGHKNQTIGGAFHDNCMCLPVRASECEFPAHVEEWSAQYDQAYDEVGGASDLSAILSKMREISGHRH